MSVPMGEFGPGDAELVAGVLAADREAFAAIYDRYGDKLYDFAHSMLRQREDAADAVADSFVIVAERLGQLREPDRLRPWLYAIVRSECLRQLRARKKVAYGGDEQLVDMADDALTPEQEAEQSAMRTIVWEAADGLAPRDRAMLDLHLRQGLDGADLAAVMGVTASNVYVMLNRLRAQVDRSLGALLIARMGRDDCAALDEVLAGWDGSYSPLIRKRVARHVDDCELCSQRRAKILSPWLLFAGVPLLAAPLSLRDRVVKDTQLVAYTPQGATEVSGSSWGSGAISAAVVALVVAASVVGYLLWPSSGTVEETAAPVPPTAVAPSVTPEPTVVPLTPGRLELSSTSVDFGADLVEATLTATNSGEQPVTVQVTPEVSWLTVSPAMLTLQAGESAPLRWSVQRQSLPEGLASGTASVVWNGATTRVDVRVDVGPPPSVGSVRVAAGGSSCLRQVAVQVKSVEPIESVIVRWVGPDGPGMATMTLQNEVWMAQIGPFSATGTVTVSAEASNDLGVQVIGPQSTISVQACIT